VVKYSQYEGKSGIEIIGSPSKSDAGASLHASHAPASQPTQRTHSMRKRGAALSYSNFEFESSTFNVCKVVRDKRSCLYAGFRCR